MKSIKSVISLLLCVALLLCTVSAVAAGGTIYSNEFNLRNRIKLKTPTPAPTETLEPEEPAEAESTIVLDEADELPDETLSAEPTGEPESEEEPAEPETTDTIDAFEPMIDVEMVSTPKDIYWYGDVIELRASILNGDPDFDYAPYIAWQRSMDGINWEPVNGTGYTFSFVMSEETTGYRWRAALALPNETETATAE